MAKFRKKPVVIEAEQFFSDRHFPLGVCDCGEDPSHYGTPHIHTLEGIMSVSEGDWVITGIKNERYPCKNDIFHATYEPVDDEVTIIDSHGNVHGKPLPDLRGLRDPNGLY